MENFVQIWTFVLGHKRMSGAAFDLMNAMFRHCPFEIYKDHLKTIVIQVLTRLSKKPAPKFQKDSVIMLSFLSIKQPGVLPQVFEAIQPGLCKQVFGDVWLKHLEKMCTPAEKKVSALGLAAFIVAWAHKDPEALNPALEKLTVVMGFKEVNNENGNKNLIVEEKEDDEEEDPNSAHFEQTLAFTKLRN